MSSATRANFADSSDTNWEGHPLRRYNATAAQVTFTDYTGYAEATIKLNTTGNLGIAFTRSNIKLDPNESYTLSCEAKCTNASAKLQIDTSYRSVNSVYV